MIDQNEVLGPSVTREPEPVSEIQIPDAGPAAPDDSTITISTANEVPVKDVATLEQRANKAHFALGPDSPGIDSVRDTFWQNQEARLRELASTREDLRQRQSRMDLVQEITKKAAVQNRPLTAQEQTLVMYTGEATGQDPDLVLEQLYARRFARATAANQSQDTDNTMAAAMSEDEHGTHKVMDVFEGQIEKQEIAHGIRDEVEQMYKDSSYAGWGYDIAKTFIPFYSWVKLHDRLVNLPGSPVLPGNNMADQIAAMYLIPDSKTFRETARAAIFSLAKDNIVLAKELAEGLVAYAATSKEWDNVGGYLDIGAILPFGTGARLLKTGRLIKTGGALDRLAKRGKAATEANINPKIEPADVLVTAGNVEEAAVEVAGKRATAAFSPDDKASKVYDVFKAMPGLMDPTNWFRPAKTVANERSTRILEGLAESREMLGKVLTGTRVIPRVVIDQALDKSYTLAETEWRKTYRHAESAILDVVPERQSHEIFGGTDKINVYLGNLDATPFETAETAANFAKNRYRLADGSYEIAEWKGNYAIRMTKPVDETATEVRDLRVTMDNQQPANMVNWALGWLRTPDDVLSAKHTEARKVLTFGGNEAIRNYREALKPIGKLSGEQLDRLTEVLDHNGKQFRRVKNPDGTTTKVPGSWYKTVSGFENEYRKRFGVIPSEKETQAYFTVRMVHDFENAFRSISMLRDKQRLGAEQYSIFFRQATENKTFKTLTTDFFEARQAKELPWNASQPFTVAWIDGKGKAQFQLSNRMFKAQKEQIEKLLASGGKIVQPLNPSDKTVRNFIRTGGEDVDFIITPNVKTKPLNAAQAAYRPHGHPVYDDGVFISQPQMYKTKFGRSVYRGDNTLQWFAKQADAQKYADLFNKARMLVKGSASDADLKFVTTELPFKSVKEFRGYVDRGEINLDVPVYVNKHGERIGDKIDLRSLTNTDVVDSARSVHNPGSFINTKYATDRTNTLDTIGLGTQATPRLSFIPAKTMDPLVAVNRSGGELLHRRFFDDYSSRTIEDWVTQFKDVLDGPPDVLMSDPLRAMKMASFRKTGDAATVAAAKNARRAILHIIGQRESENGWSYLSSKIVEEAGKRWGQKAADILEPIRWTRDSNPASMARGAAFNMTMGFWNPVQFFKQAIGAMQVAAIDGNPVRSAKAASLAWMVRAHRMGDFNPAYTTMMGDAARKVFGISKTDYEEMYNALRSSGVMNIEGEVARWDDYMAPTILQSTKDKAMQNSRTFFAEGERFNRTTAWIASYLKWRKANPTKKLTPEVEDSFAARADIMSNNQTRASNNPLLQQGAASVVTQFATYQARMAEQLLGGRLTAAEKARLLLVNTAMYGVPAGGVGSVAGVFWPVQEEARQYAVEAGWDMSSPEMRLAFNGLGGLVADSIVGRETNFAGSYGPGGLSWIRDALDGKLLEVLSGPSGRVVMSVLSHVEPFTASLIHIFDPEPNAEFPLTIDDAFDAFKTVSTVKGISTAYYAITAQKYLTSTGTAVADVDAAQGTLMAMLGLMPQEGQDATMMLRSEKEFFEHRKAVEKQAGLYFSRALRAWSQGDQKEGEANAKKARAILYFSGMTPFEIGQSMSRLMKQTNNRNLIDQIGPKFIIRGPQGQIAPRLRQFQNRNTE